jgi:hypothetical protein
MPTKQCRQPIDLLSVSNSLQLTIQVNLRIGRICIPIIFRVLFQLLDDQMLRVRMHERMERHECVSNQPSNHAKGGSLFLIWICAFPKYAKENEKANQKNQNQAAQDESTKTHDTPRRPNSRMSVESP